MNYKTVLFSFSILLSIGCQERNEELLDKALLLSKQKKFNEAISVYTNIIKQNRKLQIAYYNRGFCYIDIKDYPKALADFNTIMNLQTYEGAIISYNPNMPNASEEIRGQISYDDALYLRAQVKFYMDSLKSSFLDFQTLINNNYEEKSNCLGWQGTIWIRDGRKEKACNCFELAKQTARNESDLKEAEEMLKTYCKE
jgi:tetratricopeptide (TPR) repeat protein